MTSHHVGAVMCLIAHRPGGNLERLTKALERRSDGGNVLATLPSLTSGVMSVVAVTLLGSRGADQTAHHRTAALHALLALLALLATMHTDTLDWSLPAHRRGTLRGMDAA
ncbi:hypothetical protein LL973_00430, partial [Xanthomonas campestris pv. nigromaculans]|nr:hypothetical protein [Xanthomonas campestris pv. nigromaculans]